MLHCCGSIRRCEFGALARNFSGVTVRAAPRAPAYLARYVRSPVSYSHTPAKCGILGARQALGSPGRAAPCRCAQRRSRRLQAQRSRL